MLQHRRGPITRARLSRLRAVPLHRGPYYKPDLYLYEVDGEKVVLKDYRRKRWFWRVLVGRLSIRQEARALRRLDGVEGVPRLRGRPGADALVMSYMGSRRASPLDPRLQDNLDFYRDLERIVHEMHRRGVVHLDLKHRSNVLVTDDHRPAVIDFASAFYFREGWFMGRWLLALMKPIDLMALRHWKKRLCPGALSAEDRRTARRRAVARKFWWPRWMLDRFHAWFAGRK